MLLSLVPAMGVTASAADTSWTMVNTYDQLKAALSNQNPPDNIKLGSDIDTGTLHVAPETYENEKHSYGIYFEEEYGDLLNGSCGYTLMAANSCKVSINSGTFQGPVRLDADGNDWQWVAVTPATPNADGKQHEECANCHAVKAGSETVIPALTSIKVENLTVAKPVRDVAAATAASTDSTYYVESTEWMAADGTTLAIGDTFRSGTVYTVNITLKTAGTDVFSEKSTYNDIEGMTAAVNPVLTGDAHADSVILTYIFDSTGGSTGGGGGGGTSRYTVSFESNGGSKVSNQTVTRNSVMKEPTAPTKENFDFDGWYSDKELKTKYDFSAKVTKSFTLYAKWTEKDNSVNQIILTIGKKDTQVFGKAKSNDVAPKIEKDRTYTPIRFISENLGASVEWVEKDQKVIITKPEIKKAETK